MNTTDLWTEPKKKRALPPQVLVGAALLIALLLGTADWQAAANHLSLTCDPASAAHNCIRVGS